MKTRKFISLLDYDAAFVVFEISASLNELQICHQLNKKLKLHFEKLPDLMLKTSKEPESYQLFCYDHDDRTSFYLLCKSDQSHLIMPSYFLLIQNIPILMKPEKIMDDISLVDGVASVNQLDFPSFIDQPAMKSAQKKTELLNSIFMDLEYHLLDLSKRNKVR